RDARPDPDDPGPVHGQRRPHPRHPQAAQRRPHPQPQLPPADPGRRLHRAGQRAGPGGTELSMPTYSVIRAGWALHLKSLSMSTFFVFVYLVMPVLLAAIAFYLFRNGARHVSLFEGALGTGMMG